jgi:hypothetical protein
MVGFISMLVGLNKKTIEGLCVNHMDFLLVFTLIFFVLIGQQKVHSRPPTNEQGPSIRHVNVV